MNTHLLRVAAGKEAADLVITNGQIINVATREMYPGGIAVADGYIAAVGDVEYAIGEQTEKIDAQGKYLVPGFVEGHIHPESSSLSMARFAEVVLCHGTTSVFTDLHEIGVVGGIEAIDAMLEEGRQTPLKYYFVVPSHVPFSPGLETSGGRFDAELITSAIQRDDAVGLSEVVSMYVTNEYEELLQAIDATRKARKAIVGHGPETVGPEWNAFVAAGVTNDHEGLSVEDALLRVRNGVYAHLRHNLLVPTLPDLLKILTEHHVDSRYVCLVTDDTSAVSLTQDGHLDHLVRIALQQGIDFATAIQMVTLNPACSFHKEDEIGLLAPGRCADINIVSGPEDFRVLKTFAQGTLTAESEKLTNAISLPEHTPLLRNSFHLKNPVSPRDLVISARDGAKTARVHAMKTLPWIPLTEGLETTLPVRDGYLGCDPDQDILHIAVVERHHQTGNIGKAFIGGFGLREGAVASSMAHDNHNIVVMGTNPEDMAQAVERIVEIDGGIVLVKQGALLGELPLPLCGLLSDQDAWSLSEDRMTLLEQIKELGCSVPEPFMFLSFITLSAIPQFAITDMGYIDCIRQQIMEPVLQWE